MTKIQNIKFFYIILVVISGLLLGLILVLFSGLRAEAARLYFEPQELTVGTEKEFLVDVKIDAEKPINALSVAVSISESLTPFDINEANSIINFWVDKPNWDEATRLLTFSGITPGGFEGKGGRLLVIKFKTDLEIGFPSEAILGFDKEKTKIFLNTPDGIEDKIEFQKLSLPIVKGKKNIPLKIPDSEPPEAFIPEISQDPNLFDGKYFLVFATQDKSSGIAGYAIHESRQIEKRIATNKWIGAESPYLLKDQRLMSYIYVKAVDKAGNERIETLLPKYPIKWYEVWWNWIIIILVIIALIYYVAEKNKKRN